MNTAPTQPSASSPCTKICTIDENSQLCVGCGRTLDEIGQWSRMNEDQRLAIMALLPARKAKNITPKG